MIARFSYDTRVHVLEIQFTHGRIYEYYDVPESVFQEMITAPSKGRFYLENIKDDYAFGRV